MSTGTKTIVEQVKEALAGWKAAREASHKAYEAEVEMERKINRLVWGALEPELVRKLNSFIGHRVIQTVETEVTLMSITSIEYDKWEVRLHGTGTRYYAGRSNTYDASGISIKYEWLEEGLARIELADDMSVDDLVSRIEKARDEQIATFSRDMHARFDEIINEVRNVGKAEPVDCCLGDLRDIRDEDDPEGLGEVACFTMERFIRACGTDAEKAALPPEKCDSRAKPHNANIPMERDVRHG